VCETAANRVLRFVQTASGVFHCSVFYQFAGRFGPSAIVMDPTASLLYVARFDLKDSAPAGNGLLAVLDFEGRLVKEVSLPAPEVSGLALGDVKGRVYVTEASTNAVYCVDI
jgi:hypothetical protein